MDDLPTLPPAYEWGAVDSGDPYIVGPNSHWLRVTGDPEEEAKECWKLWEQNSGLTQQKLEAYELAVALVRANDGNWDAGAFNYTEEATSILKVMDHGNAAQ